MCADATRAGGAYEWGGSQQVMGPGLRRCIPYGLTESPWAWFDRELGEAGDPGSTDAVADAIPDDLPDLVLPADFHPATNQGAADGTALTGDPGNTVVVSH